MFLVFIAQKVIYSLFWKCHLGCTIHKMFVKIYGKDLGKTMEWAGKQDCPKHKIFAGLWKNGRFVLVQVCGSILCKFFKCLCLFCQKKEKCQCWPQLQVKLTTEQKREDNERPEASTWCLTLSCTGQGVLSWELWGGTICFLRNKMQGYV